MAGGFASRPATSSLALPFRHGLVIFGEGPSMRMPTKSIVIAGSPRRARRRGEWWVRLALRVGSRPSPRCARRLRLWSEPGRTPRRGGGAGPAGMGTQQWKLPRGRQVHCTLQHVSRPTPDPAITFGEARPTTDVRRMGASPGPPGVGPGQTYGDSPRPRRGGCPKARTAGRRIMPSCC